MINFFKIYKIPIMILAGILLIGALWFAANKIHHSIYESGYNAGVQHEQELESEARTKAKEVADNERAELNNKLDALNLAYQDLLRKRNSEQNVNQLKLDQYKKSSQSKNKSLDDSFIDIYNQSLGLSGGE